MDDIDGLQALARATADEPTLALPSLDVLRNHVQFYQQKDGGASAQGVAADPVQETTDQETVDQETPVQGNANQDITVQSIPSLDVLAKHVHHYKLEAKNKKAKKRKNSNENENSPKRQKNGKAATIKKKKKKRRRVDDIYLADNVAIETPTPEDYERDIGIDRMNYPLPLSQPVDDLAEDMDVVVASQPSQPDCYDDSRVMVPIDDDTQDDELGVGDDEPQEQSRPRPPATKHRPAKTTHSASQQRIEPTGPRSIFFRLPLEVRREIYRNLLLSPKPVLVRAGWTRIYEREKPGLDTAILRVCKRITEEATLVLYGENTFLYRLRDPPKTAQLNDIQRIAEDDEVSDVSEWDDDEGEFQTSLGSRRSRKTKEKVDIEIRKYGMHFRHLIVEAEHNRCSEETQWNMARAISVFTSQEEKPGDNVKAYKSRGKDARAKATNIHTLTVRVAPMRNEDGFTFVNFFAAESPVLEAMRKVSCQFLRVELCTKYLNGDLDKAGFRFVFDMRHRRIERRARRCKNDLWGKDPVMQKRRQEKISQSVSSLNKLDTTIYEWCEKHAPERLLGPGEDMDWFDPVGAIWMDEWKDVPHEESLFVN